MKISIWNLINNPRITFYIIAFYLAVSIVFSLLYSIVLPLLEGIPSLQHRPYNQSMPYGIHYLDCYYFSITSQTTVGYGDIVPVSMGGKIVAMVQVVFGYFYLALAVAFFTSKAIVQSDRFRSFLVQYRNDMKMH